MNCFKYFELLIYLNLIMKFNKNYLKIIIYFPLIFHFKFKLFKKFLIKNQSIIHCIFHFISLFHNVIIFFFIQKYQIF